MVILFSSCTTQYKGLHTDYKRFSRDVEYCLKKSCKNNMNNALYSLSIISPANAYGGGGGGGGGGMHSKKNRISYKTFNLCLKEKGYVKDENGIFKMPNLNCNYSFSLLQIPPT